MVVQALSQVIDVHKCLSRGGVLVDGHAVCGFINLVVELEAFVPLRAGVRRSRLATRLVLSGSQEGRPGRGCAGPYFLHLIDLRLHKAL